jgi:ABC-type glycerol-3-phosphate transport system permease component
LSARRGFIIKEEEAMKSSLDFAKEREMQQRRKTVKKVITYAVLGIWAIVVLFPFYWMILSSLKSYGDYNAESVPQFITLSPTLENYMIAFTSVPLLDYFLNTLIFTVATTALMMVVIIPAAFADKVSLSESLKSTRAEGRYVPKEPMLIPALPVTEQLLNSGREVLNEILF